MTIASLYGGVVVLWSVPGGLQVRLGGPRDARLEQDAGLEGIEIDAARQRQESEDEARIDCVQRAYGVDAWDPDSYHLMLDSTAVPLDTCAKLIVIPARARLQGSREAAPS